MVRALRSYSTSGGSVRSHPKERALKEGHEIRLRSGSAGHRPTKVRNIWGFFSSRSLKTREKFISFAELVWLSLYIF